MMFLIAALLLTASPEAAPAPAPPSGRIAALLAKSDGSTRAAAIKVRSVDEEYRILAALGLRPKSQALISDAGGTYDLLTATDPRTGAERQLWFDISSFFGHEFD